MDWGYIIAGAGIVLGVVAAVARKITVEKKESREQGKIVTELQHLQCSVKEGNANMKEHLKFCQNQCEELRLMRRSVNDAHTRIDKHGELLTVHGKDLFLLKEERRKVK